MSHTKLVMIGLEAAIYMLKFESPADFFYEEFKADLISLYKETDIKFCIEKEWLAKVIQHYRTFDKWHCGLNQLKAFKSLSFHLRLGSQKEMEAGL